MDDEDEARSEPVREGANVPAGLAVVGKDVEVLPVSTHLRDDGPGSLRMGGDDALRARLGLDEEPAAPARGLQDGVGLEDGLVGLPEVVAEGAELEDLVVLGAPAERKLLEWRGLGPPERDDELEENVVEEQRVLQEPGANVARRGREPGEARVDEAAAVGRQRPDRDARALVAPVVQAAQAGPLTRAATGQAELREAAIDELLAAVGRDEPVDLVGRCVPGDADVGEEGAIAIGEDGSLDVRHGASGRCGPVGSLPLPPWIRVRAVEAGLLFAEDESA